MLRAIDFHGLKGVEFSKGEYTVLLIPEMGANLVRLADTRRGIEILRAPAGDEVEVYVLAPERLTVDVHDEILLAVDLEMTALEMGDEFFQLTVAALGVLADEPDELQA